MTSDDPQSSQILLCKYSNTRDEVNVVDEYAVYITLSLKYSQLTNVVGVTSYRS